MNPWVLAGLAATSFIVALSGALMPGPLLTVTVGEAARRGFWAGPLIIVGHALLELGLVLLLLVGLGAWLNQPLILGTVGVLGAGMLGWMGFMTLKASRQGRLEFDAKDDSGLNPVLAGVLMSAANPYWLLWWLTIGLGYVHVLHEIRLGRGGPLLPGAHPGGLCLVYPGVRSGGRRRRFLSDGLYRGFLAGCGVFLIGFGGYFAVQGVRFFLNS